MKVLLTSALGGYIKRDGQRVPGGILTENGMLPKHMFLNLLSFYR